MRPLVLLTVASLRRLLREPRVVRSLAWPVFLCPVTMGVTLMVMAMLNAPLRVVGVPTEGLDDGTAAALEADGWALVPMANPEQAVRGGDIDLATDGVRVWSVATPQSTLEVDAVLRRYRGASWRFEPMRALPSPDALRYSADTLLKPISLLFVLYALAFGLGALARDRDEQVLDIELTMPIPAWIPAAARWAAATLSLNAAAALTVVLLQVFLPCNDPVDTALRTMGAVAAASAVGTAVVGGAGLKQGFSGPFAMGSFIVAGAFIAGPSLGAVGRWLPIFSILTDGPGLPSLLLGLATGPAASWLFQWRLARAA